jgi:hypothetical protein
MILTYSGLRHLALCCLQTNIRPNWLVTSTLHCIPLHHKMSGYGGIISDILTVCWFLIILPFSSIETILHITINLLFWRIFYCLKQWYMCMVICTFTNVNTNACDQRKLMLKICLSYLQLLIMKISFVSMTCISHCQICFSTGFVSCC